jgi:hypothetical protein
LSKDESSDLFEDKPVANVELVSAGNTNLFTVAMLPELDSPPPIYPATPMRKGPAPAALKIPKGISIS